MKLTKSTFSRQDYYEGAKPPVLSYAFDYQGVELHVFKQGANWIVGEPITGLTISLYESCNTRQRCLDETFKFLELHGGIQRINRAIKSNPRPL